jgi:hypothetical protein
VWLLWAWWGRTIARVDIFAWGWGGLAAGHGEEALVLLVGLVQHGGESRDMLPVVPLPFLGGLTGILEFITQELD